MNESSARQKNSVMVLATQPPPVTGATLVTQRVTDALQSRCEVYVYDWMPGYKNRRLAKLVKLLRTVVAPIYMARYRLRSQELVIYTVANHGLGMFHNTWILIFARLMSVPCAVHHHTFGYFNQPSGLLKLMDRLLGPRGVHIVLGDEMTHSLVQDYEAVAKIFRLSNGYVIAESRDETATPQAAESRTSGGRSGLRADSQRWVLGHLGNIRIDKGIDLVLDTHRRLLAAGVDSILRLAGPIMQAQARVLIDQAIEELPTGSIEYLGPQYGADKAEFFKTIDFFLHPTRNDAQPLVILEALQSGSPALVNDVGCTASTVGEEEWVCKDVEHFATWASEKIGSLVSSTANFQEASMHAQHLAKTFIKQSQAELERFLDQMANGFRQ